MFVVDVFVSTYLLADGVFVLADTSVMSPPQKTFIFVIYKTKFLDQSTQPDILFSFGNEITDGQFCVQGHTRRYLHRLELSQRHVVSVCRAKLRLYRFKAAFRYWRQHLRRQKCIRLRLGHLHTGENNTLQLLPLFDGACQGFCFS